MQRIRIKCQHCKKYNTFISKRNAELGPQVDLTMTDMNTLNALAEQSAAVGAFNLAIFLRHVQTEATKIINYQETTRKES